MEKSDPATGNNEMTEYGSDDDDFASIWMVVIAAAEAEVIEKPPKEYHVPSDDMDMSVG